jgi:hypothetical protein
MKNLIKIFFVLFLVLMLSFVIKTASASERNIPTSLQNIIKDPVLIGSSELKFLGLKVYNISLWSEDTNFSYNKIFAIQIKYSMNFSREDLVKRSLSEIKSLHEISSDEEASYIKQLTEIFNSVKKGDKKIAVFVPSQGVLMFHNNELTGKISNLKLARLFVDIWLDENGSYPKITKKLLGKN